MEAKSRCQELQELYKRKKILEEAGINEKNPDKIKLMFENKESADKIQKKLKDAKEK